jgi:hypothetical protein
VVAVHTTVLTRVGHTVVEALHRLEEPPVAGLPPVRESWPIDSAERWSTGKGTVRGSHGELKARLPKNILLFSKKCQRIFIFIYAHD